MNMDMQIRAETPRAKKGWGMGSTMMAGDSKIRGVKLLITEFRDIEVKNVEIIQKLGKVFSKNLSDNDEIEITNENYGLRMVKTIKQENYNNDIWDQWTLFSRKIYDNMNKVLTGK
tara:strand:- start:777 stop:1124 length:348 start_codon:yes stop_codon:yes gene_type:complete